MNTFWLKRPIGSDGINAHGRPGGFFNFDQDLARKVQSRSKTIHTTNFPTITLSLEHYSDPRAQKQDPLRRPRSGGPENVRPRGLSLKKRHGEEFTPAEVSDFTESLFAELCDPANSELLILARGLGLRRIICTLLQIFDSERNLVILVNATEEEAQGLGEELGILGVRKPGLRIVGHETPKKDRKDLYRKGGLIMVTSRILIVDMLQNDIPTELIAGLVVFHAERVTPSSPETFIVRLYREANSTGFLKAFSDQPEQFTSGMFPLKTIMKELHIRKVHIYPRFQEEISLDLGRRKADIVELHQGLNTSMRDIHDSLVQCIQATLSELKKSNKSLELDDLIVDNAYFRSFDALVRRQLDPVWHKVGPKTKQLVSDLGTLRRLLGYLLSYEPIAFHGYLESIIESNANPSPTVVKQNPSPWLVSDAADVIFKTAKRRCYIQHPPKVVSREEQEQEEGWAVLDEMEGMQRPKTFDEPDGWQPWMPSGMEPVFEELPKWKLLGEVLQEIEETMLAQPMQPMEPGNNVTLIMVNDHRTANLLREFLSTMYLSPPNAPGRHMLENRLRNYLAWKTGFASEGNPTSANNRQKTDRVETPRVEPFEDSGVSEALKRKDVGRADRFNKRRRVRGGAAGVVTAESSSRKGKGREVEVIQIEGDAIQSEANVFKKHLATQTQGVIDLTDETATADPSTVFPIMNDVPSLTSQFDELFFDEYYGIVPPEQLILVRPYGDDGDDQVLAELRPRWIIMFDPSLDFIRRIEVYRSSSPGLSLRVYLMMHLATSEEHKYLVGLRREKEAFERLIRERSGMLLPIFEDPRTVGTMTDRLVTAVSSRNAGGQGTDKAEQPRIIVDMREFRSSLPNLLHKNKMQIIPATLTVGDYIITPDICVERKSLPDLVQSFASGRLYSQCELMSVHYKQPVLLIEFEENKSFSLQTIADTKANPHAVSTKFPPKKGAPQQGGNTSLISEQSIQSKLVLLTLAFPRLRIIWSSSPFASTTIFADLKLNMPEPDVRRAISVGAEQDEAETDDINAAAEELLRSLPGVGTKNYRYVMGKVNSIKELCEMKLDEMQELLGVEPGKKCFDFLHHGMRKS